MAMMTGGSLGDHYLTFYIPKVPCLLTYLHAVSNMKANDDRERPEEENGLGRSQRMLMHPSYLQHHFTHP